MNVWGRFWLKALCWQALGFLTMAIVGAGFTGSITTGGAMAAVNSGVGLIAYVFYEWIWEKFSLGHHHMKKGL